MTKECNMQLTAILRMLQAVVEIQKRLPNARVLYVSATGATEAENLCYMTRLGLWGDKTAFPYKLDFVRLLQQKGVGELKCLRATAHADTTTVMLSAASALQHAKVLSLPCWHTLTLYIMQQLANTCCYGHSQR